MLTLDQLTLAGWSSALAWQRANILLDEIRESGVWLCNDLKAEIESGAPQVVAAWCAEDGSRALCLSCLDRHIELDHPILPLPCGECSADNGTGRPVEPWRLVPDEGGALVKLYFWGTYYCERCLRRFACLHAKAQASRGLR